MALFNECTQSCARIVLDMADIVRDGELVLKNSASGGSFFRFVFFLWKLVPYAIAIAAGALMLRNRTSRFRFWATAAR
jgi:hypothetical protein